MYRRSQRWMLIINNRFLSLYDYNFLLVTQKKDQSHKMLTQRTWRLTWRLEKIFLEKPDWKKKEKHHQTGKTKDSSLVSVFIGGFLFLSNFSLVFLLDHLSRHVQKNETYEKLKEMKIAKDRKVIPDPIDDRKFQEWKESGKSGILLGITLNPRKCIGEKVRRIPINVESKW